MDLYGNWKIVGLLLVAVGAFGCKDTKKKKSTPPQPAFQPDFRNSPNDFDNGPSSTLPPGGFGSGSFSIVDAATGTRMSSSQGQVTIQGKRYKKICLGLQPEGQVVNYDFIISRMPDPGARILNRPAAGGAGGGSPAFAFTPKNEIQTAFAAIFMRRMDECQRLMGGTGQCFVPDTQFGNIQPDPRFDSQVLTINFTIDPGNTFSNLINRINPLNRVPQSNNTAGPGQTGGLSNITDRLASFGCGS